MDISVVSGIGTGKTTLSAFDGALKNAGVYNYNLIVLSSIIPPTSKVSRVRKYDPPEGEYGYRLYVIKAEIRSDAVGKFIAAGLGWYQYGEDKRGLFVEQEIIGETKVAVKSEIDQRIKNSLQDLCKFRGVPFRENRVHSKIATTQITNQPTCVLVLAVYQSEAWDKPIL